MRPKDLEFPFRRFGFRGKRVRQELESLYQEREDWREETRWEFEQVLGITPCSLCGEGRLKRHARATMEIMVALMPSAPPKTTLEFLRIFETALGTFPEEMSQFIDGAWEKLRFLESSSDDAVRRIYKKLRKQCALAASAGVLQG